MPSAAAFLALGDVITAALFQRGHFIHKDVVVRVGIIAGSAVGLLASTLGRLYSSTYYALRDTRTPLRYAVIRVALTTALCISRRFGCRDGSELSRAGGVAGLTGIGGRGRMGGVHKLLRRTLNRRIGTTGLPAMLVAKLWTAAAVGAAVAWGVKLAIGWPNPIVAGMAILAPYGVVYSSGPRICCASRNAYSCSEGLSRLTPFRSLKASSISCLAAG